MTVGIAGRDYEFIRRFCECVRKSTGNSMEFCGPAVDSDGLWQMYQYRHPEVLVCQSGQFSSACSWEFPVVISFTLTPLKNLKLSEVKCSGESGQMLPQIMGLCAAISETSGHFTAEHRTAMEFRCAAAEAVQRYGIAGGSTGYQYIMDALELLYSEACGRSTCGKLYSAIAQAHNTTALRVERAMQRAVNDRGQSGLSMESFLQNIVDAVGFVV